MVNLYNNDARPCGTSGWTFKGMTMDETELKQTLLNGKKTERIIFAVTPDLKQAVMAMAKQDCVSASAFIASILAEEAVMREMR